MSTKKHILFCALLATFLVSEQSSAQVFTPSYMAPRQSSDIGLYLSDGPGDLSIEGIWRGSFGDLDLGLRGGLADTEDVSVLLGAELRSPFSAGTAPIDLALTGAIQGVLGDVSAVGIVGGVSLGHTFGNSELMITPYIHPRFGLIDGPGGDDFDLDLLADIGVDLRLNQRLEIRFGIGIDDTGSDWGVGLAWR